MTLLSILPLSTLRIFVTVWGLLWGSFINVVIYRWPLGLSVVSPGSRCPACMKPIAAYDNIPVLSYLLLRGRARCCGAKMGPRYALVEAIGGALSLAVFETLIAPSIGQVDDGKLLALFLAYFTLAMLLLAGTFIDLEHMLLPDFVTIGGAILGFATLPLRDVPWQHAAIASAAGFFGVWLLFGVLYQKVRGRQGMGLGDAKLMALAGAWFGHRGLFFTLFVGALQGSIVALAVFLVRGRIDEPAAVQRERRELQEAANAGDAEAKSVLDEDSLLANEPSAGLLGAAIPFGPFLILAIFEYLFLRPWLDELFAKFLGRS
jgi:leader peptidase (prepilin peptidase)/N-methyltransferase